MAFSFLSAAAQGANLVHSSHMLRVPLMDCSIQSSRKRLRRSPLLDDDYKPDYFDKLPDDILIEILDRLPMEEAMGTTFLSRRWKDLWKWKWNVELGLGWVHKTGKNVLPSLYKIFASLGVQDLRSICVSLCYDHDSMRNGFQSLIDYVSLKNVRELYIDFNVRTDHCVMWRRQHPSVLIPECELRPCLALVKLTLKSLILKTLPPSRFRALEELYLESVFLNVYSVESITRNCPLTLLCLSNCNPFTNLYISVAESSNLRHLVIREEVIEVLNDTDLCISAPNVRAIEFEAALPRKRYDIQGSLDCFEATFRLTQKYWACLAMRCNKLGVGGNVTEIFLGLLEKLRAVKVLTLSSWCIQFLTTEVVKVYRPLTFDVSHLIIETGLTKEEFCGIVSMLSVCNKLEKLVVIMGQPVDLHCNFMPCVNSFGDIVEFSHILQELEVVEFRRNSGYYETWDGEAFSEIKFFTGYNFGVLLLWKLKAYSQKLKKITFRSRRACFETEQVERVGSMSLFQAYWNLIV